MGVRATSIGVGGLPEFYLLCHNILAVFSRNGDCDYRTNGLNIFSKKGIFNKVDPVDEATGMLYSEEG